MISGSWADFHGQRLARLTGWWVFTITPDDPERGRVSTKHTSPEGPIANNTHTARESRLSWEGRRPFSACTFTIEGTRITFFRDTVAGRLGVSARSHLVMSGDECRMSKIHLSREP